MRTFIAIELEEEVKDALKGAQQQAAELCRKGNYTPKENFHLTLHFLGEIRPEEVDDVVQAMMETTRRNRPFELKLDRLGFFPEVGKASCGQGWRKAHPFSGCFSSWKFLWANRDLPERKRFEPSYHIGT